MCVKWMIIISSWSVLIRSKHYKQNKIHPTDKIMQIIFSDMHFLTTCLNNKYNSTNISMTQLKLHVFFIWARYRNNFWGIKKYQFYYGIYPKTAGFFFHFY